MKEAERYGVSVQSHAEVISLESLFISPATSQPALQVDSTKSQKFALKISSPGSTDYRLMTTDYLCIACGGYPKSSMFSWLTATGHTIEVPVPSLFTFNMPGNAITQLMGISVENARVKIAGSKLETNGPLLITHWGMSGPAVLKLSAWGARLLAEADYTFTAIINWLPDFNEQTMRGRLEELRFAIAAQKISGRNPFGLPMRLWEYFLQQCSVKEDARWADLPAAAQNKLVKILCAQEFAVKGKTTFKEEFVTAGGIKLNEVDANTMMSKLVPDLFFAGEIVDVDGITGGFNFQHAWTSAWIAAKSIGDTG
jgi:predicted Rossmann fold flavoprotein